MDVLRFTHPTWLYFVRSCVMPETIIFDTLAYAKKLKSAGFTEEQAEIQAKALASIIDEKLATKRDLKELEVSLKRDMKEIGMRLTIRIGAIQAAAIAIIAALVKLL